jgi:hypothetical protein
MLTNFMKRLRPYWPHEAHEFMVPSPGVRTREAMDRVMLRRLDSEDPNQFRSELNTDLAECFPHEPWIWSRNGEEDVFRMLEPVVFECTMRYPSFTKASLAAIMGDNSSGFYDHLNGLVWAYVDGCEDMSTPLFEVVIASGFYKTMSCKQDMDILHTQILTSTTFADAAVYGGAQTHRFRKIIATMAKDHPREFFDFLAGFAHYTNIRHPTRPQCYFKRKNNNINRKNNMNDRKTPTKKNKRSSNVEP